MKDKRFLKVKKISEERYFSNNYEFIKFIEKQNRMSWDKMCEIYQNLITIDNKPELAKHFWLTHMNLESDILKIGDFIFRIFRGYYVKESGDYTINILAEQRSAKLSANDMYKLFNINT